MAWQCQEPDAKSTWQDAVPAALMAQRLDLGRLHLVFAWTAVLPLIYGFFSTDSWGKQQQNNNLLLLIRKML